jgi:HrpA-like RNA helicase
MEEWEREEQIKTPGAVLVFIPGIREINTVKRSLESVVRHNFFVNRSFY